jgi:hypothetical protein
VIACAAYLALVGGKWRWNPLALVLPTAYAVPGLVFATVLANLSHGVSFPIRSQVYGAGKEFTLMKIELVGSSLRVLIAGAAGVLGAFAVPWGLLAIGVVRLLGCRMALRSYYYMDGGH